MQDDFDKWNEIKKKIDQTTPELDYFPQEREVWICVLGKNIGIEQNGNVDSFSRPVLIVKKFNNTMFWCIPLSSKQKDLDFYYNFTDSLLNKGSVILAQMKLVSIKRLKRKIYDFEQIDFIKIKLKLRTFIL